MGSAIGNIIGTTTGFGLGGIGGALLGNQLTKGPQPVGRVGTDMGQVGIGMGMSSGASGGYGSQQYDESGRPILMNRTSQNNPDGTIKSQFRTTDATNMGAMNQARQEALRPEGQMSKWGQMALAQGQNQNAMQLAGQQNKAMNSLAMQGGLRGGARERLAAQGMQGGLNANQNTYSSIQQQDETNRQKALASQVGNELTYGQSANQIQNTNIGRGLAENEAGNMFNMDRYGKAMEAWGAEKSSQAARAQAQSAKSTSGLFGGGGFLGLGF